MLGFLGIHDTHENSNVFFSMVWDALVCLTTVSHNYRSFCTEKCKLHLVSFHPVWSPLLPLKKKNRGWNEIMQSHCLHWEPTSLFIIFGTQFSSCKPIFGTHFFSQKSTSKHVQSHFLIFFCGSKLSAVNQPAQPHQGRTIPCRSQTASGAKMACKARS